MALGPSSDQQVWFHMPDGEEGESLQDLVRHLLTVSSGRMSCRPRIYTVYNLLFSLSLSLRTSPASSYDPVAGRVRGERERVREQGLIAGEMEDKRVVGRLEIQWIPARC